MSTIIAHETAIHDNATAPAVRCTTLSRLAPQWAARRAARAFLDPASASKSHAQHGPQDRAAREIARRLLAHAAPLPVYHNLTRLHGYRWGSKARGTRSVLLVHDWGSSAEALTPLVTPLVTLGLRVVAFDAPAHGASPGRRTHLAEMSMAAQCAIEQHGPFDVIIAQGQGCNAILHALRQMPAYRPAALVCVDPAPDLGERISTAARQRGLSPQATAHLHALIAARFGSPLRDFAARETVLGFDMPGLVIQGRDPAPAAALAGAWLAARLIQPVTSTAGPPLASHKTQAALLAFISAALDLGQSHDAACCSSV